MKMMGDLTLTTFLLLRICRARSTPEGKRFGSTMVSVGAAATAYHAARGDLRCALRKLDCAFLCISLFTGSLSSLV